MKVIHHCLVLSLLCVVGAGCSDLTWKSPDDLCGNGKLDFGEQCDEGMNNGDDKWCTSQCEMNTGVHCNSEHTSCKPAGCGNGMIDDGEECDDGEGNNGDDKWCTSGCKINTEVHCANGHTDCKPIGCGDGVIAGDEECDNGTDNSDEAWCTTLCKINPDYHCDASRKNCVRIGCGNGVIDEGEECDDGEGNNGDDKWCNSNCKINTNVHCDSDHTNCRQPDCGDGVINGDEECDDGENNGNDKWCDSECKINTKVHCDSDHTNCRKPDCGDGVINGDEECDDGEKNGDDKWCNSECKINTNVRCSEDHKKCTVIGCGDRIIEGDEECDNGTDNSDDAWCTSQCKLNPQYQCDASRNNCVRIGCGDEVVADEEVCDDGNQTDGDGCSSDCKKVEIENGYICPKLGGKCIQVECGNGIIDGNPNEFVGAVEECDEGKENNAPNYWCTDKCELNPKYHCDPKYKNCIKLGCGDGMIDQDQEECDEGEKNSDKGWCTPDCKINKSVRCDDNHSNCVEIQCGDGHIDIDEECDDTNKDPGDGCDGTCHLESGYVCPRNGGKCKQAVCGNGTVEGDADNYVGATEECDDGWKNSNTNWCMMDCTINPSFRKDDKGNWVKKYCGDGVVDTDLGETCDDGNNGAGDGCDPLCNVEQFFECSKNDKQKSECKPICGDGVWLSERVLDNKLKNIAEACDDGNKENDDGCNSNCEVEPDYMCIPRSFNSLDNFKKYVSLGDELAQAIYNNIVKNSIWVMATQRDFRWFREQSGDGGKTEQAFLDTLSEDCKCKTIECKDGERGFAVGYGHPDFQTIDTSNIYSDNILESVLDEHDKPVLNLNRQDAADKLKRPWTCQSSFDMWFNDDPLFNRRYYSVLRLVKSDNVFKFDSDNGVFGNVIKKSDNTDCDKNKIIQQEFNSVKCDYYGLDGDYYLNYYRLGDIYGLSNVGRYYPIVQKSLEFVCNNSDGKNSDFTTEIHTFIKYEPSDRKYSTRSDDDSWMFVNHRLLIDNGGIHGASYMEKDIDNKDISVGNDSKVRYSNAYQMFKGGIYPVSVFFVERGGGSTLEIGIPDLIDAQASICVKTN